MLSHEELRSAFSSFSFFVRYSSNWKLIDEGPWCFLFSMQMNLECSSERLSMCTCVLVRERVRADAHVFSLTLCVSLWWTFKFIVTTTYRHRTCAVIDFLLDFHFASKNTRALQQLVHKYKNILGFCLRTITAHITYHTGNCSRAAFPTYAYVTPLVGTDTTRCEVGFLLSVDFYKCMLTRRLSSRSWQK